MGNPVLVVDIEHALGVLGLLLAALVARLANRGYAAQRTVADRVSGFFARRAIDGIAVIGWLADHLPPPVATNGGM